ncbi:hypothetical protein PsAD2_02806 [Pseudovibrio axinellae]|uniref:Uncharacterized protein n=1 Tax=Pseudovibrio axinellae TaxID=989403 RepID=A0A165XPX2_9HYPH|nr:hypothetical protein [Pseudovibrio axinellae]KZL17929.1 hypothetical protein PsAD2_02806 [Pseudovibrio axinellae]SER76587.1 hypothetical protein SAMN05421798_12116 [Pseudovibrio axinellae]
MRLHLEGIAIGVLAGLLDCVVFVLSGPVKPADLASAIAVWTMVGWAIHTSADLPVHPIIKSIGLCLLFNIPWLIEFVFIHGQSDLLVPILVMAVVFGAAIGWLSQTIKGRRLIV